MEAFRRIPDYNFLWKFNASEMPSKSVLSNVMIQSWLPQADILGKSHCNNKINFIINLLKLSTAHPKVSAFITHSGLLSTHEAIWFGVPMIALPIYTDQHIVNYCTNVLNLGQAYLYNLCFTERNSFGQIRSSSQIGFTQFIN